MTPDSALMMAQSVFSQGHSLTHDQETDSDCLRDPDELLLVGL